MAENIRGDVMNAQGRDVEFGKDTGIECPTCHKYTLHVRSSIENSTEIECPNCGYSEHRPSEEFQEFTDIMGRKVTTGRKTTK
jgi:DNA-directed RNA polymerase subunit RPC12/RpoP